MALNVYNKTFVVYVVIQEQEKMPMHFKKQTQVRALLFDKALIEILTKYSDYNNIFLVENIAKLSENTRMNKHAVKLEEGKQLSFRPIYNLKLVELETLKIYIKTNLANGFIWLFKSPIGALIIFDRKLDESFCLYVDYQGLNNIIIKNQYLLPLISKLLN